MESTPRIGVIGAGYWGANLVRNCAQMGALAAVCDADPRTLNEVRSRYPGVGLFGDLDQMLEHGKVDAIIIAAPAEVHATLALRCIAAGKHVFVEKPLALNVADAERVVQAAETAAVTLFVGHVLLYHPAVRAMFDAIEAGKIGRVRHLRSRRLSWGRLRSLENVWWSFAPHDCALMIEIMKESPVNATGSLSAYVRPGLGDFAYADFVFADGRSAHIEVSWLDPDKSSRIDVFGSEGTLTFIDSREGGKLMLTQCGDRLNVRGEPELWRSETIPYYPASKDPSCPPEVSKDPSCHPEVSKDGRGIEATPEPLRLELETFIKAMRGGTNPTDGREGLEVVRALAMVDSRSTVHSFPLETLA